MDSARPPGRRGHGPPRSGRVSGGQSRDHARTNRTPRASRTAASTPTPCGRTTRRGSRMASPSPRRSKTYFLACTQAHWAMAQTDPITGQEMDRKPVRYGTLDDYKKDPAFAKIPPMAAGGNAPDQRQRAGRRSRSTTHPGRRAAGREHDPRLHPLTMYDPTEKLSPGSARSAAAALGHGDRPLGLHRLQRLRDRLRRARTTSRSSASTR